MLGSGGAGVGCSRLLQIRNRARHARAQALAHAEQGVAGSHQHASDGDGAHDEAPHRSSLTRPERGVGQRGAGRGKLSDQSRAAEEQDQGNQQAPGDHAAGEVQRSQTRTNYVADPEIGRADGGRGHRGHCACRQLGRGRAAAHADKAGTDRADLDDEVAAGAEQAELAEQVNQTAETHVAEQNLGGPAALLSGNVNLRGGYRLRERKLRIFDHDPAQQGHEEDAEHTAYQHQDGRFPVGVREVKYRPGAGDHECRNGEDGARGYRFADRAYGSGNVLFQQGALHQAQHRHADDRGGIGGGDGHAGAQAQISVGRA